LFNLINFLFNFRRVDRLSSRPKLLGHEVYPAPSFALVLGLATFPILT